MRIREEVLCTEGREIPQKEGAKSELGLHKYCHFPNILLILLSSIV